MSNRRLVEGVFRTPDGTIWTNRSLTWFRRPRKAVAQGGAVVLDQPFVVQTDGSGQMAREIEPGNYLVQVRLQDADRFFDIGVPEGNGAFDIADGVETAAPPITPDQVLQAQAARDEAQSAQGAAEGARDDALSAQGAAESARDDAQSAQSASESARDDAQSAQGAAESASDDAQFAQGAAETARNDAQSAQSAAESARDDAQSAQGAAESARDDAQSAQGAAETARDDAQSAQGAAEGARDASVAARDKAEAWADKDEDMPVETGPDRFSARHWAGKAAQAAASVGDPVPPTRLIGTAGLASGGGDLSADRMIDVPRATQAQAEAGTDNAAAMTPLRTAQAIAELSPTPPELTQAQAEDDTSKVFGTVSGERLAQAVLANPPTLTTAAVLDATAAASEGAVGTYALLGETSTTTTTFGNTRPGSSLRPAGIRSSVPRSNTSGFNNNGTTMGIRGVSGQTTAMSGTWRCLGVVRYSQDMDMGSITSRHYGASLWLRIS